MSSSLQSLIVNTVHDSIVIDIHPDEFEKVMNVLKHVSSDDEEPHRSAVGH